MNMGFMLKGGCAITGIASLNSALFASAIFLQKGIMPETGTELIHIVGWVNAILSTGLVMGALKLAFEYGKLTNQVSALTSAIDTIHEDLRAMRNPQ